MKGIILAGGTGSRLHPMTLVTSKQLLPVYDKPMIYYPLTTLMLAGIRDILIIATPADLPQFERLLGDGAAWGLSLSYIAQPRPEGLAQAYLLGAEFIGGEPSALILGDNIFYGSGLTPLLAAARARASGATVFAYRVSDPERYGVVSFAADGRPDGIVEKPRRAVSPWAVTGLYFYDGRASDFAARLTPSSRGELEITDLNAAYLALGELHVEKMGRGYAWLDTGTPEALADASDFVRALERRQSLRIAAPEETAYRMGFITAADLRALAGRLSHCAYGQYLERIAGEGE
jgi:glucose-1-phosphate thymidylyltransferase